MPPSVVLTGTYAFTGSTVRCTISTPFKTAAQQAACEVVMADHPPRTIYGIEEMQPVALPVQFIESMLPVFTGGAEWTLVE